jgi:hypothetical protein
MRDAAARSIVLTISSFDGLEALSRRKRKPQFFLKLEWGVYNDDGTVSTVPFNPAAGAADMTGDVSFKDSIGTVVRALHFERGQDSINFSTSSNTRTDFVSTITRATDGLLFAVTANFAEDLDPGLYFHVQHEGRNVTLPFSELMADADQKLEYVIDTDSRYKLFIQILPAR